MKVEVKKITEQEAEKTGIKNWPIWEKEESSFDWYYDAKEICYFLEGDVEVKMPDGEKVKIKKGDLAVFPKGLNCEWKINKKVRKHYSFE